MRPTYNKATQTKLAIRVIEYHRNGISGEGFNVVTFTERSGTTQSNKVAIVFPLDNGQTWNGRLAILDSDMLAGGDIAFGSNSWRGDNYEPWLRNRIAEHEAAADVANAS